MYILNKKFKVRRIDFYVRQKVVSEYRESTLVDFCKNDLDYNNTASVVLIITDINHGEH